MRCFWKLLELVKWSVPEHELLGRTLIIRRAEFHAKVYSTKFKTSATAEVHQKAVLDGFNHGQPPLPDDDDTPSTSSSSASSSPSLSTSSSSMVRRSEKFLDNTMIKDGKKQAQEFGIRYDQIMKLNSSNGDSTQGREDHMALAWETSVLLHSTMLRKLDC